MPRRANTPSDGPTIGVRNLRDVPDHEARSRGYHHSMDRPLTHERAASNFDGSGIRAFRPHDPGYPSGLLALPRHPPVVYVAGQILPTDRDAVAVVGSRRTSPDALGDATFVARGLAERGWTVVSGLARGVDSAAHRGALSVQGGRTIAVVGTGLDLTFPPENTQLDQLIRSRGAVVSQFPPGTDASRTAFPARNEIIAGLSVGSVIIVAAERSGTRIEIEDTIRQGKPVIFWAPQMRRAKWAQELVTRGIGFFAERVDDIVAIVSAHQ